MAMDRNWRQFSYLFNRTVCRESRRHFGILQTSPQWRKPQSREKSREKSRENWK